MHVRHVPLLPWGPNACVHAESYPALCGPMDCSPPGSSVHRIFQSRVLEGVPFPTPGDLPHPGLEPMSLSSPELTGGFFTPAPLWYTMGPSLMRLWACWFVGCYSFAGRVLGFRLVLSAMYIVMVAVCRTQDIA